jgi:hypothetical protein
MSTELTWRANVRITPDNLEALGIRDPAAVRHVKGRVRGKGTWVRGDLVLDDHSLRFFGPGSRKVFGTKTPVKLVVGRRVSLYPASDGLLYQEMSILLGGAEVRFRMSKRDARSLYLAVVAGR